jgi:tetratricopeptide (TPR) repeat protein
VDDIIAEVKTLQAKKNNRNKNPLPETICVFGSCRAIRRKPPTVPQPAPSVEGPVTGDTSSSKTLADKCNEAMEMTLEAAHNVEVGDYYLEKKNYKASLLRYEDAVEEKAGDAAIHVRLGRVFEKLNELPEAIQQYQAAEKLEGPEKWSQEARAALARLQHSVPASQ